MHTKNFKRLIIQRTVNYQLSKQLKLLYSIIKTKENIIIKKSFIEIYINKNNEQCNYQINQNLCTLKMQKIKLVHPKILF